MSGGIKQTHRKSHTIITLITLKKREAGIINLNSPCLKELASLTFYSGELFEPVKRANAVSSVADRWKLVESIFYQQLYIYGHIRRITFLSVF